jgi:hypothetical protein
VKDGREENGKVTPMKQFPAEKEAKAVIDGDFRI